MTGPAILSKGLFSHSPKREGHVSVRVILVVVAATDAENLIRLPAHWGMT